jgi:hypothetical protein
LGIAVCYTLVNSNFEVLSAFEDHGSIGEHFGDGWDAIKKPF